MSAEDITPLYDSGALMSPLVTPRIRLRNRIGMAPMTRTASPGGVPGLDVAQYYARRARGGTGLITTEGIGINHPAAVDHHAIPVLHTAPALSGWQQVTAAVHAAGGTIAAQLWHVGPLWGANAVNDPAHEDAFRAIHPMRPSGLWGTPGVTTYRDADIAEWTVPVEPMSHTDIDTVIATYAEAAANAVSAGFDAVALHAAHGYLLDSFVWADTNRRTDSWGGATMAERVRLPAAVVAAVRAAVGPEIAIIYRFSQHTQQDYTSRKAATPAELDSWLSALVDAGVDMLDYSARRFDEPVFPELPGSDGKRTMAEWAKTFTAALTSAVGGLGVPRSKAPTWTTAERIAAGVRDLERANELIGGGVLDVIQLGRMHLAAPDLATHIREGRALVEFVPREHLRELR